MMARGKRSGTTSEGVSGQSPICRCVCACVCARMCMCVCVSAKCVSVGGHHACVGGHHDALLLRIKPSLFFVGLLRMSLLCFQKKRKSLLAISIFFKRERERERERENTGIGFMMRAKRLILSILTLLFFFFCACKALSQWTLKGIISYIYIYIYITISYPLPRVHVTRDAPLVRTPRTNQRLMLIDSGFDSRLSAGGSKNKTDSGTYLEIH